MRRTLLPRRSCPLGRHVRIRPTGRPASRQTGTSGRLHRRRDDRHLLPAELFGPPAAGQRAALRAGGGGGGRRLPAVPPVPPVPHGAGRRLVRARARVPGRAARARRRARRRRRRPRSAPASASPAATSGACSPRTSGSRPTQLARSRRAHFARRLMDDTDLTFTQIAYASGFGSVRQLNRACQETFRAPPHELRARRRRHDRLAADGGLALRLPFRGPLDWEAMLGYFAGRAIPGVEHVADGTLPPHDRGRRRSGRARAGDPAGPITSCCAPTCRTGRASSTWSSGPGASSTSTPTSRPPTVHLGADPALGAARRRRDPACASRARGTRSRSACAPSSASR